VLISNDMEKNTAQEEYRVTIWSLNAIFHSI